MSMPSILAIHKTMVISARANKRFAAWLVFWVNHKKKAVVSPVKIIPKKVRS